MLFVTVLNLSVCLLLLVILGEGFRRLLRLSGAPTPADRLGECIVLGIAAVALFVAGGLLSRLSNLSLGVLFWCLVATIAWSCRRSLWHDLLVPLTRSSEDRWIAGAWLTFTLLQLSFVALPNIASLEVNEHMFRSGGLPKDCWLPYRAAEMIYERLDP